MEFQDHIAKMVEQIALKFSWVNPILFYEKAFWEDELLESGFCKMMVTVRSYQINVSVFKIFKVWMVLNLFTAQRSDAFSVNLDQLRRFNN